MQSTCHGRTLFVCAACTHSFHGWWRYTHSTKFTSVTQSFMATNVHLTWAVDSLWDIQTLPERKDLIALSSNSSHPEGQEQRDKLISHWVKLLWPRSLLSYVQANSVTKIVTGENSGIKWNSLDLLCTIFFILSMHIPWLHYAQHSPRLICRPA